MDRWVLLLLDGAADEPCEALLNRTPLEAASLPTLDAMAMRSTVGVAPTIPNGAPVQPEGALLMVLGYEPFAAYIRRGAWLASALGVTFDVRNIAICVSFMSTDGETVHRLTADELSDDEVEEVLEVVSERLQPRQFEIYRAGKLRHLLIWHNGSSSIYCMSPEEADGQALADVLPVGEKEAQLQSFILDTFELLDALELNERRRDEGKKPINLLLPHEPSPPITLPSVQIALEMLFVDVVTTHLPTIGVSKAMGAFIHSPAWHAPINWADRLGERYERFANFILSLLTQTDVLVAHIREPDLAGHAKDPELKVHVLQTLDEHLIRPLWLELGRLGDICFLIVCTHKTVCNTGRHASGLMPFMFYPPMGRPNPADAFYELCAAEDGMKLDEVTELSQLVLPLRGTIKVTALR
ncbi:MAG: hypothetical protein RMK18_05080 [Armatimonadota bacterium]|nr:hypothetical protein [Armatimonadota bacterium]MCX7776633.1 hypothetical protein [Armatimonadota bacterium]MDW8025224.1 hypothetical protein [Armatimonadota bacterium]